jgi:hypothetical protein
VRHEAEEDSWENAGIGRWETAYPHNKMNFWEGIRPKRMGPPQNEVFHHHSYVERIPAYR